MKTAVVVLTYNRADALLAVLRSLAGQLGEGHELLIADDGSRPEQVAQMRGGMPAFRCRVRHVWHPDTGFTIAQARNMCAERTDADYLVFIDGDSIPVQRFIRQHERLARPGHFVIGRRVLLGEALTRRVESGEVDPGVVSATQWLRWRLAGQANKLSHLVSPLRPWSRRHATFRWRGIRGCNMAFWAEDYRAVGGFDEAFTGWGHEDADIVLRLHKLGRARLDAVLGAEVMHLWHRENSRVDEEANRRRVQERVEAGMIRAMQGVGEPLARKDVVETELNAGFGD